MFYLIRNFLVVALLALLAGCGGGGGTAGGTAVGPGAPGPAVAASVGLTLTDPATGNPSNTLSSGTPLTLTALVRDSTGAVVQNAVVTFTTDPQYGIFSPAAGTALTNASGLASVTLNAGATTGASTVTASARVGVTDVTNTTGYSVNVAALGLSAMSFGTNPLSAYGTTSVAVTVTSGGALYTTPVDVAFTSNCTATGKANLPASVRSVNGVATTSYRDIGCNGPDTITASLASGVSSAATLTVNSPTVSSIQFVSASPTNISVRGMGGTEVSTVKFKVLDSAGNAFSGLSVTFVPNTTVGGLALTAASAVSDALGEVVTQVVAGTVLTPVRVTATTGAVSSQSSQLYVSTMIPDQAHFSLSAANHFLEALNTDGVTTTVTARLADRSGNPVPDGTTVVFTTEGGSIQPGCPLRPDGTGGTLGGVCTVTWTSQDPRPADGKATVLAYAIGEESFTDTNGNGRYDAGEPFIDRGEAFRDDNDSNTYNAGEFFVDFGSPPGFNAGDGLFTGVLCNSGCGASSLNVRGSLVLTFSGATATTLTVAPNPIDLGGCTGSAPGSIILATITVLDVNGNSLPTNTTVSAVLADNGTQVGPTSFTIPTTGQTVFTVRIQNDATPAVVGPPAVACTDSKTAGTLTVTVTTPAGRVTSDVVAVRN